jgi:hypothetical protein
VARANARRPRKLITVAVATLLVVVAAVVIVRLTFLRDHSSAVTVEQAQDRFRHDIERLGTTTTTALPGSTAPPTSTTTAAPPPPTLMPLGIYRYHTTGRESIDALDGADHTYPDETTITVLPDGCGVLLRWDALKERRDEWQLCATADGIELQPISLQYHEFFGQQDSENAVCDQAIVIVPAPGATTPAPTTLACKLADDSWSPMWEVLGHETRTVGSTSVDVVHVRMTVEDDDEYYEHTMIDWYLDAQGLPIVATGTKTSRSPSPIGGVVYDEQFTLELLSLTPLQ